MIQLTENELITSINIGKLPVVIYCEKQYEGICCMLKVTKNNTLFLDYTDTYDDADSDGDFRAQFVYDSLEKLIRSVEVFTGQALSQLDIEPRCYDKFKCDKPEWQKLQWDIYNGKIRFPDNFSKFSIGDMWWRGLYLQEIRPDCSRDELTAWIKNASNYEDDE